MIICSSICICIRFENSVKKTRFYDEEQNNLYLHNTTTSLVIDKVTKITQTIGFKMYPACGNGQISENIMGKLLKKDIHNTIRSKQNRKLSMKIEITKEMAMFKSIQTVDTGMPFAST